MLRSSVLHGLLLVKTMLPLSTNADWVTPLSQEETWQRLPATSSGGRNEVLPVWSRIIARGAPATAAAMLEMDRVYRWENPLPPKLRAKIRWIAAESNGCRYAADAAAADFKQAGGVGTLPDAPALDGEPEKEQRVIQFAKLLCEAAYEISDAQFQTLLEDWGPEQTTAMVLTLAYSSFQDRLLKMLDVRTEPDGPLAPIAATFDWDHVKENPLPVIERPIPDEPVQTAAVPTRVADKDWSSRQIGELKQRLGGQQVRDPRIPIPPDEVVERNCPPGLYPPGQVTKIRWNSVTFGHQPKLVIPWFFTMRRFRDEAKLPDAFRQSAFWVVTRANWCFY